MRVLVLSYEFPPLGGGAGNATAELVRELGSRPGIEVSVVTSSMSGFEVTRGEFAPNATIYYLPIGKQRGNIHYQTNGELVKYLIGCHLFLRKLLAKESFDLCHAVMTVPAGFNAWWFRRKVPYIVSLQGSDVPGYSDRFSFLYHFLTAPILRVWRDAKAVVSNSVGLRDLALKAAPDQDIPVIANGIDRSLFRPSEELRAAVFGPLADPEVANGHGNGNGNGNGHHAGHGNGNGHHAGNGNGNGNGHARHAEKRDGATPSPRRVVCVGRLIERKGVWELVEGFEKVAKNIPDAHLDLVGAGVLAEPLRAWVEEHDLGSRVTLHGAVDHDIVPERLREAAVFALPSHNEGMSNALLEGIACGLPVIVTDTGGTTELLDQNGIVVPKNDPEALAIAMTRILANDEERDQMAAASLRLAERFSWEAMADDYLEIYR